MEEQHITLKTTAESLKQQPVQLTLEAMLNQELVSDQVLLDQMCLGNNDAVYALVQRYEKKLIAYTQRIVESVDLAKDICQDVFVKLISRPPATLQNGSVSSWLFRVAHNLAIDVWRRRRFEITGDTLPEENMGKTHPFKTLARQSDIELMRSLVKTLPEEYRQIVELRVYGEVPYKDISQMLGIPTGTALWRYHEAIKILGLAWRNHDH